MHVKRGGSFLRGNNSNTSGKCCDDGMSLFQDLKLKRRKVDSRCSSDGESVGTSDSAASLSPDAPPPGEASPKDKERCQTPEEMRKSPAPPSSCPPFPSQTFIFMMKPEKQQIKSSYATNGIIKTTTTTNGVIKHLANGLTPPLPILTPEVILKEEPREEGHSSPQRKSPSPITTTNGHSSPRSEPENKKLANGLVKVEKEAEGGGGGGSGRGSPVTSSSSSMSPPINTSPPRPSPPSPSSTLIITKQQQKGGGGVRQNGRIPSPPMGNHLHARLTGQMGGGGMDMRSSNGDAHAHVPVVTSTSLSFHHHSLYRINGVRPEVISGGAINNNNNASSSPTILPPPPPTYTHHNGHAHPHPQQQQPRKSPTLSRSPNSSPQSNSSSSGSTTMLNGSMHSPMHGGTIVAGGSLGGSVGGNAPGHHHHVNLNRTPTVIMGEAGGVRTMLWSQPGQNLPPELSPPSLSSGGSPPSSGGSSGSSAPIGLYNGHSSSASSSPPTHHTHHPKGGLSMERLWASEALNLTTGGGGSGGSNSHHSGGGVSSRSSSLGSGSEMNGHEGGATPHPLSAPHPHVGGEEEDYEQPMICMICEDRATGLHYGIITCEGCKGFFKRTVQNRRVYTCVADGTCEITKAQRNRCQYCRFKKCIEQGMVLQAVREDRMPGGRNSGAVYNLYKVPVKYRKHKKGARGGGAGAGGGGKMEKAPQPQGQGHGTPSPLPPQTMGMSGTILKAALTSPNEVNHLRTTLPFEQAASMITHLVQCDNFHDIAALQNWEELLEARGDLSDKLCQMGDSIVYRLVQWTKRLPFYQEIPVEVHTRVLTHKWHELLVLTTSAWQAMHTPGPPLAMTPEEETMDNLQVLQRCLQAMMGRSLTLEQLRQDVGQMVERLTFLTRSFRRLGIRIEEYVTLKVIAMLQNTGTKSPEVGVIQERYVKYLRTFLEVTCPSHPNRLTDLLRTLPEVQAAASLLLESKMFYVPFLLNSALIQR